MGSLAVQASPAADALTPWPSIPELNDADYFAEVLELSGKSEEVLDQEIAKRATSLGIEVPTRPPTADKRNTSSAESSSTVATYHVRTFSSASRGSASTALTTHSSVIVVIPVPNDTAPTLPTPRRRSKTLSFSHYDKYLAQIDPNINQPKFLKEPPPDVDVSGVSLFSVSTRKSFASVKSGIKKRIKWKRKGENAVQFPVFVKSRRDVYCGVANIALGLAYAAAMILISSPRRKIFLAATHIAGSVLR